nr:MAG TPA: hypothetical protein [Caudoviricetes sp.]
MCHAPKAAAPKIKPIIRMVRRMVSNTAPGVV